MKNEKAETKVKEAKPEPNLAYSRVVEKLDKETGESKKVKQPSPEFIINGPPFAPNGGKLNLPENLHKETAWVDPATAETAKALFKEFKNVAKK